MSCTFWNRRRRIAAAKAAEAAAAALDAPQSVDEAAANTNTAETKKTPEKPAQSGREAARKKRVAK